MIELDVHADDYALTAHTSQDILECMKKGKLDSISVMVNMSCSGRCIDMLIKAIPELPFLPKMSIHLDFVEGKCLAGGSEVSAGKKWKRSYRPFLGKSFCPVLSPWQT